MHQMPRIDAVHPLARIGTRWPTSWPRLCVSTLAQGPVPPCLQPAHPPFPAPTIVQNSLSGLPAEPCSKPSPHARTSLRARCSLLRSSRHHHVAFANGEWNRWAVQSQWSFASTYPFLKFWNSSFAIGSNLYRAVNWAHRCSCQCVCSFK